MLLVNDTLGVSVRQRVTTKYSAMYTYFRNISSAMIYPVLRDLEA